MQTTYINDLINLKNKCTFSTNNKNISYWEISASFDIETSSFYIKDEKQYTISDCINLSEKEKVKYDKNVVMYIWMVALKRADINDNDYVFIYGRTWKEFIELIKNLHDIFNLSINKRLLMFVHNLSYEFQFIKNLFNWESLFASEERQPLYAINEFGIEFRCSYRLSGYGLSKVAEHLVYRKIEKMVGDLDYNKIHHNKTPLTQEEMGYCKNDVLIVIYYIDEEILNYKSILYLPLTKTGKVRKYIRDNINKQEKSLKYDYNFLMKNLTIDKDEYIIMHNALQGGFTHANINHVNTILENVKSMDETSAYPYMMLVKKYPMSKGQKVKIKSLDMFYRYIRTYCCIFDIEFTNLQPQFTFENYLSFSKCAIYGDYKLNNGRVVYADKVRTSITEIDFDIISKFYTWDEMRIGNFYYYHKAYLPKVIIESILKLYEDKTLLKGVKGKESEYLNSKEQLNSVFGMTCTNIVHDVIELVNGNWGKSSCDLDDELRKYNKSYNRFLFYGWGIYITAYNRQTLTNGMLELKDDYIYADTDSLKFLNYEKHMQYFNDYNEKVLQEIKNVCNWYDLDINKFMPKTQKGVSKIIGVWDDDGFYNQFKTLGAKRYLIKTDDYQLTISGVNKSVAMPYLIKEFGDRVFDAFDDGLYFPPLYTGKLLHTYIDCEMKGKITDYLGNTIKFKELSGVHLEPTSYDLSLDNDFINYIFDIQEREK